MESGGTSTPIDPCSHHMPSGCSLCGLCSCFLSSDVVPWFRQAPQKAVEPEIVTSTQICPSSLSVPDNIEKGLSFGVSGDCILLTDE